MPAARQPFAHRSERVLATLLDLCGVDWEYEPLEFALAWDGQGRVVSAFRPDFWLPTEEVFLELTTSEQRLVTRKNAKVRRCRELYPEVRIEMVYQRQFRALLQRHGLAGVEEPAA